MAEMAEMKTFEVSVPAAAVDDLRRRLEHTRWPDQLDGTSWEYGTDKRFVEMLCRHWAHTFDWDAFVARCNAFPQFLTTIDGQQIHFIHARSPVPSARPLLLSHGWPGSVAEFFEVVGPLSDPARHGGNADDAFHVVAPSLPGFGFSGPTTERGWNAERISRAFAELMATLGYDRYFVQGGDWGSLISMNLGRYFSDRVAAVHVNSLSTPPPDGEEDPMSGLTERELADLAAASHFTAYETGYQRLQATKPQTVAYGLSDSPAGLAAWLVEKFHGWSDCDGDVEKSFTLDRLLDNISIYWLTGTINSSMRIYFETIGPDKRFAPPELMVPLGHARFPAEISRTPRRWAEAAYPTLVHWTDMPRGGHFAAMEAPDAFVAEVRSFFRGQPLR
jgi:epoxide hydrolase